MTAAERKALSRAKADNPFPPQLPRWFCVDVPPLIVTPDVAPLIAGEELLPVEWTIRRTPEYWEKVLRSHGLGVRQPLTDNDPYGSPGLDPNVEDGRSREGRDDRHLRRVIGKDDRFMNAYQIKKRRGLNTTRTIPDWAMNDMKLRELVVSTFPDWQTNGVQKRRAERWLRVVYFYYRKQEPRRVIAKEMGMTMSALDTLIRDINRKMRFSPPSPQK